MTTRRRLRAVSLLGAGALAVALAAACTGGKHHADPHATNGAIEGVALHAGTNFTYSLHAELVRPPRPDLAGRPRGVCATPEPTITPTKWLDAGAQIMLVDGSTLLAMARVATGGTIVYAGTPANIPEGDYAVSIPGGADLLPVAFPSAMTMPAPVVAATTITLAATGPSTLTWNAGGGDFVRLVWIDPIDNGNEGECIVPDSGSFDVPQEFANALPLSGHFYVYRYVLRERDDSAVRVAIAGASGFRGRFYQPGP